VRRQLFVTVAMLQADGLDAEARSVHGLIEVHLGQHHATFPATQAQAAADWLAQCAVIHHPEAGFSKLWFMLADLAGGVIPFGSR